MAVLGNTLSEIGDVLFVYSQGALAGDVTITSYTDITVGETATRYFVKTFRYSLDGMNYSDWDALTNTNLQNITGSVTTLLFLEFRYERAGTDNTGLLEFGGITLNGNIIIQICNNTTTMDSLFEELACNDMLTAAICNNLLKKIYNLGILPEFIQRGPGIDDKDFVSFWNAVCYFLAFVSAFANEFDKILYKRKYLVMDLQQRGSLFCSDTILFSELQYIAKNFYNEIRRRGTKLTYQKVGTTLLDGYVMPIDGEWLRILCRNRYDEFLLDVVEKEKHGWCIGNSSPLYNGNYKSKQINKTEENTENFVDLNLYEIQSPFNVNIVTDSPGVDVAEITTDGTTYSGFGYQWNSPPPLVDWEDLIIVDKEIDYEITFRIKREAGSNCFITFGVHGYNRNGAYKPLAFERMDNGLIGDNFFVDFTNDMTRIQGQWYNVRGIIYSKGSPNLAPKWWKTNLIGQNLRFSPTEDVEMVKPYIQVYSVNTGEKIRIHDFKMRPLIKGKHILGSRRGRKPYVVNPQFVQGDVMVMNWLKNNNDHYSNDDVTNKIQENLLPYEQKLIPIYLTKNVSDIQLLSQ